MCVKIILKFCSQVLKTKWKFQATLRLRSGRKSFIHPPPFKNEWQWVRGIGHSMRMVLRTKMSVFGSQKWLRFIFWFIMILYHKMRQIWSQNATAILLKIVTKVYYKMRKIFHYKMRRLLQNASAHCAL